MSLDDVARKYAVAVSPTLLTLIDPADPGDPIARQFLPEPGELRDLAGRTRRSHRRRGAFAGARHCPSPSRPRAVQGGVVLPGLLPFLFPPRKHRARQGQRAVAGRIWRAPWTISPPIRKSGK